MAPGVEELRRQLREKFPQAHASDLPPDQGLPSAPPAERFHPGLFPAGAISEVIGSGLPLLLAALIDDTETTAALPDFILIDGRDQFDPASFTAAACSRLLWVRCRETGEMLKAADLLVRDGNVPFVLLDTCGIDRRELTRLPASVWWRLKLSAEARSCRLVVMSARPQVPCASLRLALNARLGLEDFDRPRCELLERLELTRERERKSG